MTRRLFTLAMMLTLVVGAWAQDPDFGTDEVISNTTLWTFDQFQVGDVIDDGNGSNYAGLYLKAHNTSTNTSKAEKSEATSVFGDKTIYTVNNCKFAGGSSTANAVKGSKLNNQKASSYIQDCIGMNIGTTGTLYITASANSKSLVVFQGNTGEYLTDESNVTLYTSASNLTTTASVHTISITKQGTCWITASGAYNIYAIKFVPTTQGNVTKKITMSKYGVMTFSDKHAWSFEGTGLKAYYLKSQSSGALTPLAITNTIPACTGVVLVGTPNQEYTLTLSDANSLTASNKSALDQNYTLRPVITDYTPAVCYSSKDNDTDGKSTWNNLLLKNGDDKMLLTPTDGTTIVPAGGAYYRIRKDQQSTYDNLSLNLSYTTYTLTTNVSPTETGTIVVTNNGTVTTGTTFLQNTDLVLTANPAISDYVLNYWSTDGTEANRLTAESDGSLNLSMTENKSVYAVLKNTSAATPTSINGATVTLSETSFTYNGASQAPTVSSVVLGNETLSAETDYDVNSITSQTEIGDSYTVSVTGKGNYTGTASATWAITRGEGSISFANPSGSVAMGTTDFSVVVTKVGDGTVAYSSSEENVATIDVSSGLVTPVSAGTTTITATVANGTNYDYAEATATYTLTVTAEPVTKYAITLGDHSHGSLSVSPEQAAERETVTVTAEPDNGYQLSSITITKTEDGTQYKKITDGTMTFTMPGYAVTVKVTYGKKTYTISYELDGGSLEGDATNPTTYNISTESFTLNNPTKEGYTFAGWTGTDLSEATMIVTIAKGSTGNREYTATWESTSTSPTQYTLNIGSMSNGKIQISSTDATTTDYNENTELTLTAVAEDGYEFESWMVDDTAVTEGNSDNIVSVSGNTLNVKMTKAFSVAATFKAETTPSVEKAVVILTAGQSNTAGRCDNANLPDYIKTLGTANNGTYQYCQWSYTNSTNRKSESEGLFRAFWPERESSKGQFAYDAITYYWIEQALQKQFYVIKHAEGGTSIDPTCTSSNDHHWSADATWLSANTSSNEESGLSMLKAFESNIDKSLTAINGEYDIKCMLWHQGESDRTGSGPAGYKENLKAVVAHVRNYLVTRTGDSKYATLPFIAGTVPQNSKQYNATVRAALDEIASEDANFFVIETNPGTFIGDRLHFDSNCAERLGIGMYNKMVELGLINGTQQTVPEPVVVDDGSTTLNFVDWASNNLAGTDTYDNLIKDTNSSIQTSDGQTLYKVTGTASGADFSELAETFAVMNDDDVQFRGAKGLYVSNKAKPVSILNLNPGDAVTMTFSAGSSGVTILSFLSDNVYQDGSEAVVQSRDAVTKSKAYIIKSGKQLDLTFGSTSEASYYLETVKIEPGKVTETVSAPVISSETGTAKQTVTITAAATTLRNTPDIYYTTDGTDPTTSSAKYTEPFELTEIGTYTVKAIAVSNGVVSEVATETVIVAAPELINIPTISIDADGLVTITAGTSSVEGATIMAYYTTDGTEPTNESTEYTEPFEILSGTTVKAISINTSTNVTSEVESQEYTYDTSVLNKISKTTTWTFGIFDDNQPLANSNTVYGYKGLYLKGHSETSYAQIKSKSGVAAVEVEGESISVGKYLNLTGGNKSAATTDVANNPPTDRAAFCVTVPGTVYAYIGQTYKEGRNFILDVDGTQTKFAVPSDCNDSKPTLISLDIANVKDGGSNVFIGGYDAAVFIYAIKFVKKEAYSLDITSEHGTVTVKRDGAEEATEDRTFVAGTNLTLTAEASQGYTFSKWTVGGEDAGTEATLSLTMDAAKTVVAVYDVKPAVMSVVTITQPSEGGIVKVMNGETEVTSGSTVADGTTLTVAVTPDRFYQLDKITIKDGNDNDIQLTSENTFQMPESAVTVTVTLTKEEVVNKATTWVFNDYTTSDTETKGLSVANKLYNRSASSGRGFAITELSKVSNLIIGGTTDVSVSKISKSTGYNNSNMANKTAGSADNETTPFFAFNTDMIGTCYAWVKPGTKASDNSVKAARINFGLADGTNITNKTTSGSDLQELALTSTASKGVFFIGSTAGTDGNPCEIYAIRFVPSRNITVADVENGKISTGGKPTAGENETITLTITPNTGYVLTDGSVKVNGQSVEALTSEKNGSVTTITLKMPDEDITVTASFEAYVAPTYNISMPSSVSGGSISASSEKAAEGETVTIAVTPDSGKRLTELTATYNDGTANQTLDVTAGTEANTYQFIMPAYAVSISATFGDIPSIYGVYDFQAWAEANISANAQAIIGLDENGVMTGNFTPSDEDVAKGVTVNGSMTLNEAFSMAGTKVTSFKLRKNGSAGNTSSGILMPKASASEAKLSINWLQAGDWFTFQTGTNHIQFAADNASIAAAGNTTTVKAGDEVVPGTIYLVSAPTTAEFNNQSGTAYIYSIEISNADAVTPPVISVDANNQVTIDGGMSLKGNAVKVYYTRDNSDPTDSETRQVYAAPFTPNQTEIIRAYSVLASDETVASAEADPVAVRIGSFEGEQNVFDFASAANNLISIEFGEKLEGIKMYGSADNPDANADFYPITNTDWLTATTGNTAVVAWRNGTGNAAFENGGLVAKNQKYFTVANLTSNQRVKIEFDGQIRYRTNVADDAPVVLDENGQTVAVETKFGKSGQSSTALFTIKSGSYIVFMCESTDVPVKKISVLPPLEYVTLTKVVTPEGAGTIIVTEGGAEDATEFEKDSEVILTATANTGYRFVKWTDGEDAELTANSDKTLTVTMNSNKTVKAVFEEITIEPTTPVTFDFMGAYEANNSIDLGISEEQTAITYRRNTETTDRTVNVKALTVNTTDLPVDGRIAWQEGSVTINNKGLNAPASRVFIIKNLKQGDIISMEYDGMLYYAKGEIGNALKDMTTGEALKSLKQYEVSSVDEANNYLAFWPTAATTISQISINQELACKVVSKPSISSTYTVNEDSYTYTIGYMEGATLHYTLPGGEEQTATGGTSIDVDVAKIGELTAYAKYGEMTSETLTARVYAPTPKIESEGVYDFSLISSSMLKDYVLGTIGYGEDVTVGNFTLHKPDDVVSKTLDRFAFADNGKKDWQLLSAGRLRSKNAVADTLAVLDLHQGEFITFTYSGAELRYMSQGSATLADGTDVLTSGTGYEVQSDGILLLTVPVTEGKNCDITKISIAAEEIVSAPTIKLREGFTNRATITPGTSTIGKSVTTYYTIDGTEPTTESTAITKVTNIGAFTTTTTVKAFTRSETGKSSAVTTFELVPPTFTVTLPTEQTVGTVTANKTTATEGETVKLTITPAEGYYLAQLAADGGAEINANNNFSMPAANVTITATFEKEEGNAEEEVKEVVAIKDDENAKVTAVSIPQEATTVAIRGTVDNVPVTEIGKDVFTAENTANVAAIDLSETAVNWGTASEPVNREAVPALQNINEATLVYLPETANVTGTNVVTKSVTGGSAKYACSDFQVTDGKTIAVPHEFTATSAKLNRTFTADRKCTVCLPYNFTATGGTFYEFTGINNGKVQMTAKADGATLNGNTPYIFVPNNGADGISAQNVEVRIDAPETKNTAAQFTFIGTFNKMVWDYPEGIYGFAAEDLDGFSAGQFVRVGSGASIEACRAFLQYTGDTSLSDVSVASTRGISVLPDKLEIEWIPAAEGNGTTGIHSILTEEDKPIYNMSGQRVDSSYKGLVIQNGKVVLKK